MNEVIKKSITSENSAGQGPVLGGTPEANIASGAVPKVVVAENKQELIDAISHVINQQQGLLRVLKMFQGQDFSPEFGRRVNIMSMRKLVNLGNKMEDAILASLNEMTGDDNAFLRFIDPELHSVVMAEVNDGSDPDVVTEELSDKIPVSEAVNDATGRKKTVPVIIVDATSEKEEKENDPPGAADPGSQKPSVMPTVVKGSNLDKLTTVDNSDVAELSDEGGFFGNLLKKGAALAAKLGSSLVPGGSLAYGAASNLIPKSEASAVTSAKACPVGSPPPAQYWNAFHDWSRAGRRHNPEVMTRAPWLRSVHVRPLRGGPSPIDSALLADEVVTAIADRRLSKAMDGAIDASSNLPFILPVTPGAVEVFSAPVHGEASFPALQFITSQLIPRENARSFRTLVTTGTATSGTVTLDFDETAPGGSGTYSNFVVPCLLVSFGLSMLEGVSEGVVTFEFTIPQGTALSDSLESQYEASVGYRKSTSGEIGVKLISGSPDQHATIAIFPWTTKDSRINYQPGYVRTDGQSGDNTNGMDRLEFKVTSAPKGTYVSVLVPGVNDEFTTDLTNRLLLGIS